MYTFVCISVCVAVPTKICQRTYQGLLLTAMC